MIERNMPGVVALSPDELTAIAEKSCRAQGEIGPGIQWVDFPGFNVHLWGGR
jgi:hypothetical protein